MDNIVVLLCSQRKNGRVTQIKEDISVRLNNNVKFIEFSGENIAPCIQCAACKDATCHAYTDDDFNRILGEVKDSDIFLVISPLYSPVPSKLAAFLERLTSVCYFGQLEYGIETPLKGKKCGVLCYDSSKINTDLEGIIKKVIKPNIVGYLDNEDNDSYKFLGESRDANVSSITEYMDKILKELI